MAGDFTGVVAQSLHQPAKNAHFAAELCVRNQIVEELFNGPPAGFEGTRTDAKRPELCNVFPTCEASPHQPMREFLSGAKIRLIYFRVNKLEGLSSGTKVVRVILR